MVKLTKTEKFVLNYLVSEKTFGDTMSFDIEDNDGNYDRKASEREFKKHYGITEKQTLNAIKSLREKLL